MGVRLLTPPGRGAVAVLSVRGAEPLARLRGLLGSEPPPPGGVRLGRLRSENDDLDEALVCTLAVGDVELHLHGSPPLVDELIGILDPDPRPETAPRASVEDRARRALAEAPCEAAARLLLDQAEGALRAELAAASGLAQGAWEVVVDRLLERGRRARYLLRPPLVVVAGPVNAGKSTLFNLLVGEARTIVSRVQGTTRDTIRERAELGPWPVDLVDTAGERPSPEADAVERAGQELAREVRGRADLVLWLEPCTEEGPGVAPAHVEPPPRQVLSTFADRLATPPAAWPAGCIAVPVDPEGAGRTVENALRTTFRLPAGDPWQPGAGVPFEADLCAELARLRPCGPGTERRQELDRLLH